jgi:hypothetical protein
MMAKKRSHRCGEKYCFHGAFTSPKKAKEKKAKIPGASIINVFIGHTRRSLVVTKK